MPYKNPDRQRAFHFPHGVAAWAARCALVLAGAVWNVASSAKEAVMRRGLSVGARYRLMRTALVVLRRIAVRYSINFDNAAESSAKEAVRHGR